MSSYKSFAVVGAGTLGSYIIDELLKQKLARRVDKIVVLTRSFESKGALEAKGAETIAVNYESPSSMEAALQGIDVVISTVGPQALGMQVPLAAAAKVAGVKLFVLSEFGSGTVTRTDGLFGMKLALRQQLEQIGMPWAVFYNGPFADWLFYQPYLGFDLANGKANIGGRGDSVVSFTSRTDIARYVAYVTTNLAPEKLHNRVFLIEGERTTFNAALATYEKRTGRKLDITHTSLEEVKECAKNPADFAAFLTLLFETDGTYGTEEEMNVDWPDFKPESVVDAILSYKA